MNYPKFAVCFSVLTGSLCLGAVLASGDQTSSYDKKSLWLESYVSSVFAKPFKINSDSQNPDTDAQAANDSTSAANFAFTQIDIPPDAGMKHNTLANSQNTVSSPSVSNQSSSSNKQSDAPQLSFHYEPSGAPGEYYFTSTEQKSVKTNQPAASLSNDSIATTPSQEELLLAQQQSPPFKPTILSIRYSSALAKENIPPERSQEIAEAPRPATSFDQSASNQLLDASRSQIDTSLSKSEVQTTRSNTKIEPELIATREETPVLIPPPINMGIRNPAANESMGFPCGNETNSTCCGLNLPDLCLCVGHVVGKGVGYRTGYTSVGIMATGWTPCDNRFQPFVDIRGHVFDNGEQAANVGLGARYFNERFQTIVGANIYYDYRRGRHRSFNQIGFGAELLGNCWDFRINGYVPVGKREGMSCKVYDDYEGDFFAICFKKERSLAGFDAEVGSFLRRKNPCNTCDFDLYGAIGPYYFSPNHGRQLVGGLARLQATWLNCINVEVIATTDRVFHQRVQGRFELCIPLGGCCALWDEAPCCNNYCSMNCQRVQRREIIALEDSCNWETNYGYSKRPWYQK